MVFGVNYFHIKTTLMDILKNENAKEPDLAEELLAIGKRCAALPLLDKRSAEQILGYNAQGLPE